MRVLKTRTTIGLAALSMLAIMTAPAAAKHGGAVRQKQSLESTGTDADAFGLAKLLVKNGSEGTFTLQVKRLIRNTTYEVLVDGVRVGSITTTGGGNGKIRFRSRPRAKDDRLLGFDPRGAEVLVEAQDGTVVLRVTLTDTPPANGEVVCCIPDDDGAECEDRTADECATEGGTVSTATSCLPNPCAGASPPSPGTDVICCIPDDSGPECEDRTTAECAAEGGVTVVATSCAPNPCAPTTPPVDPDIQCCLPDDSGFECEDRTPAECAAQGGTDMGAGTCTPDPCASLTPGTGTQPGDDNGGGSGGGGHDDGPGHA